MNNAEKIIALLEQMQRDIGDLQSGVSSLKSDMEEVKETLAEHSEALGALIEWTDNVQEVVRVPFAKPGRLSKKEKD